MVKRLQEVGCILDEIVDALQVHDAGGATCESERWRLETVRDRIDRRIADLVGTRDELDGMLAACRAAVCEFASGADGDHSLIGRRPARDGS